MAKLSEDQLLSLAAGFEEYICDVVSVNGGDDEDALTILKMLGDQDEED
jgi:hypothetical protein